MPDHLTTKPDGLRLVRLGDRGIGALRTYVLGVGTDADLEAEPEADPDLGTDTFVGGSFTTNVGRSGSGTPPPDPMARDRLLSDISVTGLRYNFRQRREGGSPLWSIFTNRLREAPLAIGAGLELVTLHARLSASQ